MGFHFKRKDKDLICIFCKSEGLDHDEFLQKKVHQDMYMSKIKNKNAENYFSFLDIVICLK